MKVGSLIELVNDNWGIESYVEMAMGMTFPVKKSVYTVRDMMFGGKGLLLEEISNSHLSNYTESKKEPAFLCDRFREIIEAPTSISIEYILESERSHA